MAYSFHPSHLLHAIRAIFFVLVFSVFAFFIRDMLGNYYLPCELVILVIGGLSVLANYLSALAHTVELGDRDLTYTYGILSKKEITLPIDKITEASCSQSISQQIFGLGTLKVITPGVTDPILIPDAKYSDIKKITDLVNEKA